MDFFESHNSWTSDRQRTLFRNWVLRSALITLITWFGGPTPAAAQAPSPEPGNPQHSTVQDFLSVPVRPIAQLATMVLGRTLRPRIPACQLRIRWTQCGRRTPWAQGWLK